jgi:hypothetical protein
MTILRILAVVLIVLWLLGWLVFHLLGAAIHIVLGLAVVLLILGFMKKATPEG